MPCGVPTLSLRWYRARLHREKPRLAPQDRIQHGHEFLRRNKVKQHWVAVNVAGFGEEIFDGDVKEESTVGQLLESLDVVPRRQILVVQA